MLKRVCSLGCCCSCCRRHPHLCLRPGEPQPGSAAAHTAQVGGGGGPNVGSRLLRRRRSLFVRLNGPQQGPCATTLPPAYPCPLLPPTVTPCPLCLPLPPQGVQRWRGSGTRAAAVPHEGALGARHRQRRWVAGRVTRWLGSWVGVGCRQAGGGRVGGWVVSRGTPLATHTFHLPLPQTCTRRAAPGGTHSCTSTSRRPCRSRCAALRRAVRCWLSIPSTAHSQAVHCSLSRPSPGG